MDEKTLTLTFDKDLKAMTAEELKKLKWPFTIVGAYVQGVRHSGIGPDRIEIAGKTLTLHLRSQYAEAKILPGREISVEYRADIAAQAGAPLRERTTRRWRASPAPRHGPGRRRRSLSARWWPGRG